MYTTRWCYNGCNCVFACNLHILKNTFANLISICSLNNVGFSDIGHAHFCCTFHSLNCHICKTYFLQFCQTCSPSLASCCPNMDSIDWRSAMAFFNESSLGDKSFVQKEIMLVSESSSQKDLGTNVLTFHLPLKHMLIFFICPTNWQTRAYE